MNNSDDSVVRPVVGHPAAWGKQPANSKVQPYVYTAGSTDTMAVRVREKIDIHGVGADVVDMQGMFVVRRDSPCPVGENGITDWGKCIVKTEFRALELYGESPVFGSVRVHLDPEHSSHGEVGPADAGSLAATCVAHCFPRIELPNLGLTLTTAGKPIALASKVVQIPPVGDVARSENSALLLDEHRNVVGEIISSDIEVGEVLFSVPLGTSGAGERGQTSGEGFYTRQPSTVCLSHTNPASNGQPGNHIPPAAPRSTHSAHGAHGAQPPAPRGAPQVTPPRGAAQPQRPQPRPAAHQPPASAGHGAGDGAAGALGRLEGQLQQLVQLISAAVGGSQESAAPRAPQPQPQPQGSAQDAIDAAVFRRLITHLRARPDAANDQLMDLAGFCRDCLSKWYQAAAAELGSPISIEEAKARIYGLSPRG